MIYFILLLILILAYKFFSSFRTDYTLNYLLGRKGAGKTSYMVKLMLYYQKRGWTVYTDLKGIKIPGVRLFDLNSLKNCTPPPRSAVFLDEVGLSMDNRQYASFSTGLRDWYALQRHFQAVVFLNSQAFDVEKKVRERVDKFLFLQKIGPLSIIRPIIQDVKPNDMSNPQCDNPVSQTYRWGSIFGWRILYLPKYQKYFDSFIVPHREEVPFVEIQKDVNQASMDADRISRKFKIRKKRK